MKKNIIQLLIAFIIGLLIAFGLTDLISYLSYVKGYDFTVTSIVVILLFAFISSSIIRRIKRSLIEKEMIEFLKKNNKK